MNATGSSSSSSSAAAAAFAAMENATLEYAASHGQISTLPLTDIIKHDPRLSEWVWVAPLVDAFIVVSVSVSFITLGTGLKHVLDGIVFSCSESHSSSSSSNHRPGGAGACARCGDRVDLPLPCPSLRACVSTVLAMTTVLYGLGFGLILLVALCNPEGFLKIIEIFGSLALNVECGIFVALMARNSNTQVRYSGKYIPLPLTPRARKVLVWFSGIMFSLAVVYDVFTAGIPFLGLGGWLGLLTGLAAVAGVASGVWVWWARSRRV